ncbi:bifunctional peptidase and arginyl-hydroxylase JMJD5-like [Diadema antillarum]|uniref:bifunctional peptidase and arginyl-hydroxylase JMJD5-like n=1 Tax=Diadema antillarum TaxID=105358 RepID=UPI003A8A2422
MADTCSCGCLVASLILILVLITTVSGGDTVNAGKVDPQRDKSARWPGHLEPLGSKAIKRSIPILEEFPSPKTFFLDHVLGSLPVLFRGGGRLSPAFKLWTDQYLRLRPESQTTMVDVEVRKKENRKLPTMRVLFSEFLERYKTHDEYMVDGVPKFLRDDVVVPPPLVCDDILERIVDAVMWFSSGGTKSVLHNDDTDNINCLFSGQKEILFINYTQYRHKVNLDHPEGSYSSINVEEVDMEKYPGMRDVEFYYAKMFPGDCVYIPYKWIHQVNSIGRNLAVNLWWEHSCENIPSPEICGDMGRHLTLADISLVAEKPLPFHEDFEEDEPNPYQKLLDIMALDETVSFEDFKHILQYRTPELSDLDWNEECDHLAREVYDELDVDENGVISRAETRNAIDHQDSTFHFRLEGKLLMMTDIGHEQAAQKRLREYEIEKKKKATKEKDPSILIQEVEPLDLEELEKLLNERKKMGEEEEAEVTLQEVQPKQHGDPSLDLKVEL